MYSSVGLSNIRGYGSENPVLGYKFGWFFSDNMLTVPEPFFLGLCESDQHKPRQ
jgi:hypothetical protein